MKNKLITFLTFILALGFANSSVASERVVVSVDTTDVLNTFERNPVGLNLNALLDKNIPQSALTDISAKSLRFPLGEVADLMLFDKDKPGQMKVAVRDPDFTFTNSNFTKIDNSLWKNNLQFDRFMSLVRTQNAVPYIVVGIDALKYNGPHPSASKAEIIQAAKDWVHYANIVKGYGIQHWEIGNENDLSSMHVDGEPRVRWTAQEYGDFVVEMSRAMKSVDPSIKVAANGMTTSSWWHTLLPIVRHDIDFVVTHQYSPMKSYGEWAANSWTYRSNITNVRDALDFWEIDIPISVTEISSLNQASHWNNSWKALHNLEMFGNALEVKGVDQIHMWISTWLNSNPMSGAFAAFNHHNNYELLPMGYATKIWSNAIGKNMVKTTNAGPIRSWASVGDGGSELTLFLLNKHSTDDQTVQLDINAFDVQTISRVLKFGSSSAGDVSVDLSEPNPIQYDLAEGIRIPPFTFIVITMNSISTLRSPDSDPFSWDTLAGVKRIKNRGHYLHAGQNYNWEPLVTNILVEKWWSQRWHIQIVDAQARIVRIANLWTGRYLTVENRSEASPVFLADGVDSWWSQQWIVESVPNSQDLRLKNRWTKKYLSMADLEGGVLVQSNSNLNSMANRFHVLDI